MITGVADTHTVIWHTFADPRLSPAAKAFIDDAARNHHTIVFSSMTMAEIVYLIEKARIPAFVYDGLKSVIANPKHAFKQVPFTIEMVDAMRQISRARVPDMPDRIIAATALHFGVPLISRDGRIQASVVNTIW